MDYYCPEVIKELMVTQETCEKYGFAAHLDWIKSLSLSVGDRVEVPEDDGWYWWIFNPTLN